MDNLFYTYSSNNRSNIVSQSQIKKESLVFSSAYHSIFVNGTEYGASVNSESDHYKALTYSISYGTAVDSIEINPDGSVTSVKIPGMINFSDKGHFVSAVPVNLKHGTSGVIKGYYNTKDNTTLTYGSYFNLAYFNVNEQGHIDSADNKTIKSYFISGNTYPQGNTNPPHIIQTIKVAYYEALQTKDPNTIYFLI